ncbi:GtrA family protein [Pusillimonas sp. ANT_WB101]|uniref:GtrA family protein n=1 Tax=Pusillimonas sp. ANT_WB101 TaxID=2597356 RepID=UPI0011EFE1B5|nr:GtrA family protein [Pusillimonas sp. ANT_WB101]KAA0910338.1 GtrA family protein [Pusillimonas sp. ANT_WB101]
MSALKPVSPSAYSAHSDTQKQPGLTTTEGASLATQVLNFLISGGFATLLHWAVMAALAKAGMQPVWATSIGAVAGSFLNYVLQFYWTFRGNGMHGKAIPAYVCAVILGWCVNAGIFYLLISFAHFGLYMAQICATAVVAIINFIIYKRMVFHECIN